VYQSLHKVQLTVQYSCVLVNCLTTKLKPSQKLHCTGDLNPLVPYNRCYCVFPAQAHIHKVVWRYLVWTSWHSGTSSSHFNLLFHFMPPTDKCSRLPISLFSVWCAIFSIRFFIITNFIITVTRFYFWEIPHSLTLTQYHNWSLFCAISHTREIAKDERFFLMCLFQAKIINRILSFHSSLIWCPHIHRLICLQHVLHV
jgi:hypothetical protein